MSEYQSGVHQNIAQQNQARGSIAGAGVDPWVNRSSEMRCRTCIWFARKEPQSLVGSVKATEIGRCRRHAPTMGGYPVVYMSDWCGDHRIDENKI